MQKHRHCEKKTAVAWSVRLVIKHLFQRRIGSVGFFLAHLIRIFRAHPPTRGSKNITP